MRETGGRVIANLLLQNLIWFGTMDAVLFVSAGALATGLPGSGDCALRERHRLISGVCSQQRRRDHA